MMSSDLTDKPGRPDVTSPGIVFRQILAQMPGEVCRRNVVLGVQTDQNFRVAGANGSVRAIGLVDAGVGQTDVVENGLQLSSRDFLAQRTLHLVAEARRLFDAQSRASPQM